MYIELRCRYDGTNNGKLSLSYQCAADLLGIGKSTVKRAFDELTEKGFIIRKRQGQWYGRLAAEYIVTDRGMNGHPPTRDWRRWRPDSGAKKQKSVPVRNAKAVSVPQQYRKANFKCRQSTRAQNLCTSDGAAGVPPILSCGGSSGGHNHNFKEAS